MTTLTPDEQTFLTRVAELAVANGFTEPPTREQMHELCRQTIERDRALEEQALRDDPLGREIRDALTAAVYRRARQGR